MNIEHVLQIQIEGENYPSAGSRARQMFGTRAWVAEAGNGKLCSGQNFKNHFFYLKRFVWHCSGENNKNRNFLI